MKAFLILEDGTVFTGKSIGSKREIISEIVFNTSASDSYDIRTAKHEMGHAFGLDHTENSYSIMFPNINYTYVTTVQQCDHDTINYLYN